MKRFVASLLVVLLACYLLNAAVADEPSVDILDVESFQKDMSVDTETPDVDNIQEDIPMDRELILDGDLELGNDGILLEQAEDLEIDGSLANLFQDDPISLLDESRYKPGYAVVARGTIGYQDVELARPEGEFTDEYYVWAETFDLLYSAVQLRFDTEETRASGDSPRTCFVRLEDVQMLTEQESEKFAQSLADQIETRNYDGIWMPTAVFEKLNAAENGGLISNTSSLELDTVYRTQAEIQAFVDAHPAYLMQPDIYDVGVTKDPYSPAKLSQFSANSAIAMVNQMRFIAGLDANVVFDWDKEDVVSSTALINGLNGKLSHYPNRPAVLSSSEYDSLYSLGYEGASSSNLCGGSDGYGATTFSVVSYVSDTGLAEVGHRLWVLSPVMGKTAFGSCPGYPDWLWNNSAMYAFDDSATTTINTMAWPAREMPVQYFKPHDHWSFSWVNLQSQPTRAELTISLTRLSDNRTWFFSESASDGDYTVSSGYGNYACTVSFLPDGLDAISAGDVFDVKITDTASDQTISYSVRFFNLDLSKAQGFDKPEIVASIKDDGNHITWDNVNGATKYIICRGIDDNGLEYFDTVDANQSTYEYIDNSISKGSVYTYAVYAANDYISGAGDIFTATVNPLPLRHGWNYTGTIRLLSSEAIQLTPTLPASHNREYHILWDTSDREVAYVNDSGLVTAIDEGSAIITAWDLYSDLSARVLIEVVAPQPDSITITKGKSATLYVGSKLSLKTKLDPSNAKAKLTWISSNSKVATVSQSGKVTPKKAGTTKITVKTDNNKKAAITIKIVDAKSVKLKEGRKATLKAGKKLTLHAVVSPSKVKTKLTWMSSNDKVATVSSKGVVTAKKPGTAKITVTTKNQKSATITITVK